MRENETSNREKRGDRKKQKGMQFRLYLMFVLLSVIIVALIGVIQVIAVRRQARQDTVDSLAETARNISSTYGTSAFRNAISSVIYQGEYRVRVMKESGEMLIDTSDLSVYLKWPEIQIDVSEMVDCLNHSEGSFYLTREDTEGLTWIVYGQVVAKWDDVREILLITKSTQTEVQKVRQQIFLMVSVAGVSLLASFLLSWYLAKSYLKPIREITGCAEQLVKENYDIPFPSSEYAEIATLSDTLKLAADSMVNYEKNRRDMIANVSHDMRTPLTMIKAYAEMIKTISGDNPEKRGQHLDIIIAQADHLSEFVNQTLELSQLQSRTLKLKKTVFSMADLLQSVCANLQAVDQGKHEFRLFLEPDTRVSADVNRVEQMIQNLVNNSLKYGGRIIDLKAGRVQESVRLEIIDYGEGIPKEKLPYIWTKYYRIKPYGKENDSAGVGLSIVKEIAEMHEISYGVESDVNQGVHFWFDFPSQNK